MEGFKFSAVEQNPDVSETRESDAKKEWVSRLGKELEDLATPSITETTTEKKESTELHKEELRLNNCTVELFGVNHTPDTLHTYLDQLRTAVKGADMVVLEGSPEIQLGSRTMSEDLRERTGENIGDMSPVELRTRYITQLGDTWERFFQGMSDIAAIEGKQVALVDPANLLGATEAQAYAYKQSWSTTIPKRVLEGSGSLLAAGLAAEGVAAVIKKNPSMDRRGFLRGMGRAAVGAAAVGLASQGTEADLDAPDAKIRNMSDLRRGAEEAATYSLIDLRNIAVAEKLEALSKTLPAGAKIAVVYGDGHRKSIKDYLAHPDLREIKKQEYRLTNNFIPSNAAIGVWGFNFENGAWEKNAAETSVVS